MCGSGATVQMPLLHFLYGIVFGSLIAIAVTIKKRVCACVVLYSNRVRACQGEKMSLCLESCDLTVWYLKMD